MNYKERLVDASSRNQRLGIGCPRIEFTNERYFTAEGLKRLEKLLTENFQDVTPESITARCVKVHREMQPAIDKLFDCTSIFTIGYIDTPQRSYYKRDEAGYLANLTGMSFENIDNFHCWLTLPSMEIIDLTFCVSLAVVNDWDTRGSMMPITSHPDELKAGLTYHPMLIGTDFFEELANRHGIIVI